MTNQDMTPEAMRKKYDDEWAASEAFFHRTEMPIEVYDKAEKARENFEIGLGLIVGVLIMAFLIWVLP